ncbi:unnamed protein product [Porites lobata]|uniref:Ribosomal protein L33 n=1 Tax=Porites lobata TaxID=104759 RepID=A0ABN8RS96_9CNID|nr:unnamed protein product [Porites lobata]
MQKKTTNWSVQKMTGSEGILKGDVTMFLSLKDGKNHRSKKAVKLPTKSHYVEHRLVRTDPYYWRNSTG